MTVSSPKSSTGPDQSSMSFLENTLDRMATRRPDKVFLESRLDEDTARVVLSTPTKLFMPEGSDDAIGHRLDVALSLGAKREEMVFLGQLPDGSTSYFATTVDLEEEDVALLDGFKVVDLRTLALQAELSPNHLGVLAQARALIHWHRTHQFCSRCGDKTHMAEGGYRRDCPSCEGQHFPRTDPCVIMLITDGDRALLGRPPRLMEGVYTTLAGFMEPGETIEQAVRRETMEESGIRVGKVELIANQPWPFPANLMLGCVGEALSFDIHIEDDELEACKWCDRDEVRQMVAGTHPEGHLIPPPISIAHELIMGWLEKRI